MSDEAGKAAKDTIAEYIQKLKDGKKDAVAAAKDVAASVALALQNSTTYTPSATPTTTVPAMQAAQPTLKMFSSLARMARS